jgi:CHASE3 domain sensor protein
MPGDLTTKDPVSRENKLTMNKTKSLAVSLVGVTFLIAVAVAASFWAFNKFENVAEMRKHIYDVMNGAERLLSELKDAEVGQNGYLLTGDEAYLEPYLAVRYNISGHLKELRLLTTPRASSTPCANP